MKNRDKEISDIKEELTNGRKKHNAVIKPEDILSSGSALLNLGMTGRVNGGYVKGLAYRFIGDSSTGKTWFTMTCLAEAAQNPNFDDYQFIYDGSENGLQLNVRKFFGEKVHKRLRHPQGTRKSPEYSKTVKDMYHNLRRCMDKGPCIFIEDSLDALSADEDEEIFEAEVEGKKAKGTMGTAAAKDHSRNFRLIVNQIAETKSILILISQTRQKIGYMVMPGSKTHAGGMAVKFFTHVELWTKIVKRLKKEVHGIDRVIGSKVEIEIQKNRTEGWEGKIVIPFLKRYGIDDIGSCIDYLIQEKHWGGSENKVVAPEFEFKGSKERLVEKLIEEESVMQLHGIVAKVWKDVESQLTPNRPPRYV